MKTGPTNENLQELIKDLRKTGLDNKVKLWARIADDLSRSTRQRRIINLYKLDKCAKDNETVIVPGKVLGTGNLSRKITVAAFSFSDSAIQKINKVGKSMTIKELIKTNPKGSKVRILG